MSERHERGLAARGLIGGAWILAVFCFGIPLAVVLAQAFGAGFSVFVRGITEPSTRHALWLTVITALVVVPINAVFGLAAAWAVTHHRFPGRRLVILLVELPLSVSPIVAGVAYLFVYGAQGLLGPTLASWDVRVMFTWPAIVLVSLFVTSPFVAREVMTLLASTGNEDEEAAVSLGAGGWQTFLRVTLPRVRWALLHGVVLCNARVLGEFGAVSVVSGNIRGRTNTLPLQIELLMNDYDTSGAFAAAAVLTLLALLTLAAKYLLELRLAFDNDTDVRRDDRAA